MSYVESVGIPGLFGLTGAKTAYQDEGILLGDATAINFTGDAVQATLNDGLLTVDINGGGSSITVVQDFEDNANTVPSSAVLFSFGASLAEDLADFAPKDNPTFTGEPTAPTPDYNANNTQVATTEFVQAVVGATLTNVWKDQGNFDASNGTWPTSGAHTLAYDATKTGYLWRISTAGTLNGGVVVSVGDSIRALVDNAGNTSADWAVIEGNIGYMPENASNKVTTLANPAVGTYPTTQTVVEALDANLDATVNTVTTTSYTLGDITTDNNGKTYLRMTSASANTVTIPATQTKPISISQRGTGVTTLATGAGVTLNGNLTFTAQHQTKTVIPVGSSTFDVVG